MARDLGSRDGMDRGRRNGTWLGSGRGVGFSWLFGIVEVAQVAVTNKGGQLYALRNMLDSLWRLSDDVWSYIVLETWNCRGKSRLA